MTKRLFLAINLPLEIKARLADLVLKLQKSNKNKPIKWVGEDNFHLTLHFLGDVPEEKISEINQYLEPIINNFPTLNFSLSNSISAFPDLNNPKVIFLDMLELNDGQTIKLQKETGQALERLGFEIDTRPFRLHLTLGRVKFKTSLQIPNFSFPAFALQASAGRQNSEFIIHSIDLMESNLTPSGPIYNMVKQYKFQLL
ncbi:MAG: RNA 2',3'-cyclic phosphodiesterase [Candidatus Parcubacteria bacterium]|nr:RNA 2',3'-cyclic phosphodiesterase [Candidatus Parcubacteria bacterium]